jgi:hypothetical protein
MKRNFQPMTVRDFLLNRLTPVLRAVLYVTVLLLLSLLLERRHLYF